MDYTAQSKNDEFEIMCSELGLNPEEERKRQQERADKKIKDKKKYTQGVFIDKISTPYGEMFKITLDIDKLKNNESYSKGKVIFCIKQARDKIRYYPENLNY